MDFYERECAKLVEELTHASEKHRGAPRHAPGEALQLFQPYEVFRAKLAALVRSAVVRKTILGLIEAEHVRSVRLVLAVTQRGTLLENQPTLARSIRLRNPCVDPLSFLQIRFLAVWRRVGEKRRMEPLCRLLALTVKGVASGMKSTG